jgi:hypothetical protein
MTDATTFCRGTFHHPPTPTTSPRAAHPDAAVHAAARGQDDTPPHGPVDDAPRDRSRHDGSRVPDDRARRGPQPPDSSQAQTGPRSVYRPAATARATTPAASRA